MNRSMTNRLLFGAFFVGLLIVALTGWAVQGFRLALTVGGRLAAL